MALLGNVLVIPGAFLVVFTGCLSLGFGCLSGFLAEVCNHANRVFITALLKILDVMAAVPAGHLAVKSPPWGGIILWYALILSLAYARVRRRTLIASASIVCIAACTWVHAMNRDPDLHVFPVGKGHAILIDVPGADDVLIDPGAQFSSRILLAYLRRCGVNRLRAVVLSDAKPDRAGALDVLLDELPVNEVWCTPYTFESDEASRVATAIERRGVSIRYLTRGDGGLLPGGIEWEVLHPLAGNRYRSPRTASPVIRVARGASSVLIVGAPGRRMTQELLEAPLELMGSVLVLGRVTHSEHCSETWLREVSPDLVIFSSDRGTSASFIRRLETCGAAPHRVDEMGAAVLRLDGEPIAEAEDPHVTELL